MERNVQIDLLRQVEAAEARLQDADNHDVRVRDPDGAAEDRRIGGEAAAPVTVAQHGNGRGAAPVVIGAEFSAEDGTDSQHVEVVVRNEADVGTCRHVAEIDQQPMGAAPLRDYLLERIAVADLLVSGINESGPYHRTSAAGRLACDDEQALGMRHG